MPSLNRIQLIGRLGKDPESRTTPGNRNVVTFSVATGHRWKDKQGEGKTLTDWFNIEAWGKWGGSGRNTCARASLSTWKAG
jgi:single-strand DNA-binding protein